MLLPTPVARAQEVKTTIDFQYTYTSTHEAGEVTYTRQHREKYVLEYLSTITSYYDFSGKLSVEYTVAKATDLATTRKLAPTLDLKLRSDNLEVNAAFTGSRDYTAGSIDTAEIIANSATYVFEVLAKPDLLPEIDLKLQRVTDYQELAKESVTNKLDLSLKYKYYDFDTSFKLNKEESDKRIPENTINDSTTWEYSANYGHDFSDLLDLQLEYNIKEKYAEDHAGDYVFYSSIQEYTQKFKSSLKSAFEVPKDFNVSLTYDFTYEQDFMRTTFDHKATQHLLAEVKRSLWSWANISLKYEANDDYINGAEYAENTDTLKNKVTGEVQLKPATWLDVTSKLEREWINTITANTGGTVADEVNTRYETNLRASVGENLKLTATQGYERQDLDDLMKKKSTKYKFSGTWKTTKVTTIEPSYDISLDETNNTDLDVAQFESLIRTSDARVKFAYDQKFLDYLQLMAEHTYEYKKKQTLDAVLNLENETDMSEDSKIALKVAQVVRDMTLEVSLSRKATDTQDDEEPMIVNRTLSVKWDWLLRDLKLSASYQFDDMGDADDTLNINTKVAWKRNMLEISGEYQYIRTFSEEISEEKKYDLKLGLIF